MAQLYYTDRGTSACARGVASSDSTRGAGEGSSGNRDFSAREHPGLCASRLSVSARECGTRPDAGLGAKPFAVPQPFANAE